MVRDTSDTVIGVWFANPSLAADSGLVEALLAKHDLFHLVGSGYRRVANTVDHQGGMFVMFAGNRLPGEPARSSEPGTDTGRSLEVNGRLYPLHEDFEAFSADAAAGKIALLKTTISGLSMDDYSRLFGDLAARYGDDSPRTRAIVDSGFHCLTCFRRYSSAVLLVRDHLGRGGRSNARDITACVDCGGQDAVWIYDPTARGDDGN